jgi:hypothetical protein
MVTLLGLYKKKNYNLSLWLDSFSIKSFICISIATTLGDGPHSTVFTIYGFTSLRFLQASKLVDTREPDCCKQQSCQMVSFQTKNPNLGKFWGALPRWENVDIIYIHLECFTDIWDILWPFGLLCVHLVHFSGFGTMHREKSGNPGKQHDWRVSVAARPAFMLAQVQQSCLHNQ